MCALWQGQAVKPEGALPFCKIRTIRTEGGSSKIQAYFFSSMKTSTSGHRLATGCIEGLAITLQKSLLSVEIDSR